MIYKLEWCLNIYSEGGDWLLNGVPVACEAAGPLLGWPFQDITVRVETEPFEGGNEVEIRSLVEQPGGSTPIYIDGICVDDHYPDVMRLAGSRHFHVGLVT